MSADIIGTYAVAFCLLIGSFFTIVGVIGLVEIQHADVAPARPNQGGDGRDRDAACGLNASLLCHRPDVDSRVADHGVPVCDGPHFSELHRKGKYPSW